MSNASKPRRRFVELSIYLENDVMCDPPLLAPRITCQKHADTSAGRTRAVAIFEDGDAATA